MVTVIADKEELSTPVNNGVTIDSNDNERPFQYIKDYREVDLHRSSSCKPLPKDLVNGAMEKSSIEGTFFVQVDLIEPLNPVSNNQSQSTPDHTSLILTLTDGIITVRGITNDPICDSSSTMKPGCKLLLTGVIPIKNGFLQLTHDNTRFQYGSNTFPRPRSAYRGRVGGSYRPSYEGRRGGGGGNSNTRYDNDDNGSNFLKRPPPKTLMDFMTLKISDDSKPSTDNENQKLKDRSDINKRRNPEQNYPSNKLNNGLHNTTTNHYHLSNHTNEQMTSQPDGMNEYFDPEDDLSQSNYRERRNPLPPRLQRAQEERTRRNTGRHYDESVVLIGSELNGNYRNGTTNNPSMSSLRHGDLTSYIPNTAAQHNAALNSYPPHPNMIAAVNGSTATHLPYYPTNPGAVAYSLCGIPSPPFHNQSSSLTHSYPNEPYPYCYGTPYATPTYLPPPIAHTFIDESKHYNSNNQPSTIPTNSSAEDIEPEPINESPVDENIESENKSQSSSSSSSNDGHNNSQQLLTEQSDEKHRNSNPNPRPRWKIGDMCLARWSEDRQFYVATVIQIHPPSCTVLFRDYNNYDQVHFSDLKVLPRDPQYYQFIPPIATTSDLNALAASVYFPTRPNYYTSTMDGCLIMPEAPPFPFNSAGTLYMYPPTVASVSRANRSSSFQQPIRRTDTENSHSNLDTTINSTSPTSKDSNDDPSINNSTTLSLENHQENNHSCSIADAPVSLVTDDDERDRSTSTASIASSKSDEQQLTTEDEKQEKNSD